MMSFGMVTATTCCGSTIDQAHSVGGSNEDWDLVEDFGNILRARHQPI